MPVIASRLGSLAEVVKDKETGLLFDPGDAGDLAAKLQWAQSHPEAMQKMGMAARSTYEKHYTPDCNYEQLTQIYAEVIRERGLTLPCQG